MLAFDSVIMLLQGRAGVGSSGHLAAERLLLSGVARRRALVVLLVGFMGVAPAGAQSSGEPDCVRYPHTNSILPNGYPFDAYRAVALFASTGRTRLSANSMPGGRLFAARGDGVFRLISAKSFRPTSMRFETAWPRPSRRN
jgi:hypothetical protein